MKCVHAKQCIGTPSLWPHLVQTVSYIKLVSKMKTGTMQYWHNYFAASFATSAKLSTVVISHE